jgi:hypothetical protein
LGTRLNSRGHLRSRLRGPEGRTIITITHEQVTDRGPLRASKLRTDSNDDIEEMVSGNTAKRTAEKAMGLAEANIFQAETRSHPRSDQELAY